LARPLTAANVDTWLRDWTALSELVGETQTRLEVAVAVNTEDKEANRRFHAFLDTLLPAARLADQKLADKLLATGLEPHGFDLPLRKLRVEAQLFREANLPLMTEEQKLNTEYYRIAGAQTVQWQGQEVTVEALRPVYQERDRAKREHAWRLANARQLADRPALNELWARYLVLRRQMAANAGFPDYRAYRWQQLLRFDYTPQDCATFRQAIAEVVVPAVERLNEERRQLGLDRLRPWDLDVDITGQPPLRPFADVADLESKVATILGHVDARLSEQFRMMCDEGLLDLDNRKGKAPGGFCTYFPQAQRPFIFMNAVGIQQDVEVLLHEIGHAVHDFAASALPYAQQREVGMEFGEVASMAMELLGAPYLSAESGGFYSPQDTARARIEQMEGILRFLPYVALVDGFQHWVYAHPDAAADPAQCDAEWSALRLQFMPGIDWSGLEAELAAGWQQKLHIFCEPFYYVEYGLAQLGAIQVWRNALRDQAEAVARYRQALALGGTASLPELYQAAGARFAFDAAAVGEAVALLERTRAEQAAALHESN
jgi:oligoendopeptidase F